MLQVSSGLENSLSDEAFCTIKIDRTCVGCQAPAASPLTDDSGLSPVAIAFIALVCILVPVIVILALIFFLHRRRHRKHPPPALQDR